MASMLDETAARSPHDGPLLICGFQPFPAAPRNPAMEVIEALREEDWSPAGRSAAYALIPTHWDEAAEAVLAAMATTQCAGVLLVGVAVRTRSFRVEMRAQNRTSADRLDASGEALGRDRISVVGPAVIRATAPVAAMLAALRAEDLPATASSDAGAYLCNYTLYRVLADGAGRPNPPPAGFLHVPQARELAGDGAASTLPEIERAVRTAAEAFADALQTRRVLAVA
jgi:pyroglutamyl-peptidase